MNIIITALIVLAIIVAVIGFFVGFMDTEIKQPVRADFITIMIFLVAIFFLLLAITLKIY